MDINEKKKDLETAKDRRHALLRKLNGIESAIHSMEQALADELCPFKEGDKVVNDAGEIVFVGTVRFNGFFPGKFHVPYKFKIRKMKGDGTPYMTEMYSYCRATEYKLFSEENAPTG
tara:strand:+ start:502 stop:852 length:351 start_codon:yes stop_codon:yes gene_type:complete